MRVNCDIGEAYGAWRLGDDEAIMPHIALANVACGFHAGDPTVMAETVALAKRHDVAVGAHPSYPDLQGFGRRVMEVEPASPAAQAGLARGDLLVAVDGATVDGPDALHRLLGAQRIGSGLRLSVLRGAARVELTAVPRERN